MDYEEKYKDLVKRLNKAREEKGVYTFNSVLDVVAPELKIDESKDDRISNEIIQFLQLPHPQFVGKRHQEEWIAWLEKKGEQKPDTQHFTEWNVSDFRTWQYIVSDVLTKKDGIGQYLDSGECKKIAKYMQEEWGRKLGKEQTQEELCKSEDYGIDGLYHAISILEKTLGKVDGYQSDDGILEHKCAINAVKEFYEQKPTWSVEDETMLRKAIITIDNVRMDTNFQEYYQGICDWLESLKDKCLPQPKQEWSEEDDKILKSIIINIENLQFSEDMREKYHHILNTNKSYYQIKIDWLKSLKDRVQPKQEWSKEDEKKLLCVCAWIKDYPRIADFKDEMYTVANNYINWLKSLRPQNRWKPSDKQMDALHYVTNFDYGGHKATLVSLYEQLKKLKG